MRHLITLLLVIVAFYVAYNVANKQARSKSIAFIMKHGVRLGFVVVALLVLIATATRYSSISLV